MLVLGNKTITLPQNGQDNAQITAIANSND